MSIVVLVLSMFAVEYCYGVSVPIFTDCNQLPKVKVPRIETLVANSPFQYDYSLSTLFDCASKSFTYPLRGTTNYNGTALNVQGATVTAFQYAIGSDKESLKATVCSTGQKSVWYMSAAQFDNNGGFYCIYTCNNTQLKEFGCASNNNGASPVIQQQVNLARRVLNGARIHSAKKTCPASRGCNVF